ncbi:MAG: hypothetical protein V4572_03325 [Bacteroidota bacterium]
MKKHYAIFLVLLFFTISCKKNSNNKVDVKNPETVELVFNNSDPKYLLNPPKSDTLCSNDIERAKRDINKYQKLFIKTICFGCRSKPFEAEIEEVLKKRKIKKVTEDIGCVVYEGQTQGCYSGFISLKMKEQYGENYFSEIEKEAESLFIKNIIENNKVVSIYDLEDREKPKIISREVSIESDYYTTIKANLPVKINSYKSLFADITFIIEKDGTIGHLSISNWVNDAVDEKFKKDLISIALKTLKENYSHWNPGKYKGNIVRTENTLRVGFR